MKSYLKGWEFLFDDKKQIKTTTLTQQQTAEAPAVPVPLSMVEGIEDEKAVFTKPTPNNEDEKGFSITDTLGGETAAVTEPPAEVLGYLLKEPVTEKRETIDIEELFVICSMADRLILNLWAYCKVSDRIGQTVDRSKPVKALCRKLRDWQKLIDQAMERGLTVLEESGNIHARTDAEALKTLLAMVREENAEIRMRNGVPVFIQAAV